MVKLLTLPAATVKPRMSFRPLSLPLGTYEVRFGFSSLRVAARVTIEPLAETTVRLQGKGRAVTATVETRPVR